MKPSFFPPGRLKEKKKENQVVVGGAVNVHLDRLFKDGLADEDFYAWEDRIRTSIAERIGVSPERVSITGVGRSKLDKETIRKARRRIDGEDEEDFNAQRHELTTDHLEEMRAVFERMERDEKTGTVNARSFVKALSADPKIAEFLHIPLRHDSTDRDTLMDRFKAMDLDGNMKVDFEEFVSYFGMSDEDFVDFQRSADYASHKDRMRIKYMNATQESDVRRIFNTLDRERHGYVTREAFAKLPKTTFDVLNRDGDAFVTIEEFLHYFDGLCATAKSPEAFQRAVDTFFDDA
eukprot:g2198.t1